MERLQGRFPILGLDNPRYENTLEKYDSSE